MVKRAREELHESRPHFPAALFTAFLSPPMVSPLQLKPSQMPVVEFLVQRGANVNHRNAAGNTSLHFAMSYDTSGKMGEYLINNGADDTIENKEGLSPCEYFVCPSRSGLYTIASTK